MLKRSLITRRTNEATLRRKFPYGGAATLEDLGKTSKKWNVVGYKRITSPSGGIITVPRYRLKPIKPGTGEGGGKGTRSRSKGEGARKHKHKRSRGERLI